MATVSDALALLRQEDLTAGFSAALRAAHRLTPATAVAARPLSPELSLIRALEADGPAESLAEALRLEALRASAGHAPHADSAAAS